MGISNPKSSPITDTIITALSQLVDDAQTDRRDPSHSDIEFLIRRHGLVVGDPNAQGRTLGKAKRVRAVLNWAIDNNPAAGGQFILGLISVIQGHGGFRDGSPNFVGQEAISNCSQPFDSEGYVFTPDGDVRPKVLEYLNGLELTEALQAYARRARMGSEDAALLVGTGKDLLEATSAHILTRRYGAYSATSNFPTLLGQTFVALGLTTPQEIATPGEPANRRVERAMYDLACAINALRNKEGTGHGRPWLPGVTDLHAKMAIELIGVVAEHLLVLDSKKDA